jgi:hypothetical protein
MKTAALEFESRDRGVPPDKAVRPAWLDERGQIRCLTGRCIDVSRRRVHVEVPERIALHTRVMLRANEFSVADSTSVKYVTGCDTTFILVLDL